MNDKYLQSVSMYRRLSSPLGCLVRTGILLATMSTALLAEGGAVWITRPPGPLRPPDKRLAIPETEFFEIVASRLVNAESDLQKVGAVPISEAKARSYTGEYYRCANGKRPYLVRAVYGSAGTGSFMVVKNDGGLWVVHGSVSAVVTYSKTALVVNLDFEPTAAFATVFFYQ